MRTPFSLLPCVYYEFTAIRETGPAGLTGSGGPVALAGQLMARPQSAGHSERWQGSSGEVPFLVRDATGTLPVDPAGAIVEVSRAPVLHDLPMPAGFCADGGHVTVIEKYIPVGFPIYVLGELKREALATVAPQAVVAGAAAPAESPRPGAGHSDRLVLGRPVNGGLFIVSERSERELIRRLCPRFDLALLFGSAALALGAWQISRFLGGPAR